MKTLVPETGVTDLKAAFQIVRFLDIVGETEGQLPKRRRNLCATHEDKEKELYCKVCEELVCLVCTSSSGAHYNHANCLLEEVTQILKQEMIVLQEKLEKQIESVEGTLQRLHDLQHKMGENQETLRELIDSDNRKEIFMNQNNRMYFSRSKGIEKQQNKFKVIKSQLISCHDFLKNAVVDSSLKDTQSFLKEIKDLTASAELDIISGLPENLSCLFSMETLPYKGKNRHATS